MFELLPKPSPPDHTDHTDFHGSENDPGRRDAALLRLSSSANKQPYLLMNIVDRSRPRLRLQESVAKALCVYPSENQNLSF